MNSSIVQYAQQAYNEGWGYIYGTSGQEWTKAKQESLKAKYESDTTKYSNYMMSATYGGKWIGHIVSDCAGLIVYACKQLGFSVPSGSNSLWSRALSRKGKISETSALEPGALVFKLRNNTDYYHVGIYCGDGTVIEAKSTQAGVTVSSIDTWSHYGYLKVLDDQGKDIDGAGIAVVDVPNDGTVNVRKKPSTQAHIRDTLNEGDQVEVIAVSGDWATVQYVKKGYIMKKFLRKQEGDNLVMG